MGTAPDPMRCSAFAAKMGVELTEGEANKLVSDWRDANPEIVEFWYSLDDALHAASRTRKCTEVLLPTGAGADHPAAGAAVTATSGQASLTCSRWWCRLIRTGEVEVLTRVFHGVHPSAEHPVLQAERAQDR